MTNLDLVASNGDRGVAMQLSYTAVQTLEMSSDDTCCSSLDFPGSTCYPDICATARARLVSNLDTFDTLHQSLYLQETSPSETIMYTVPSIEVMDLVDGVGDAESLHIVSAIFCIL